MTLPLFAFFANLFRAFIEVFSTLIPQRFLIRLVA
jgi:hypothetical protein